MEGILCTKKLDKACSTDEDFRIDMEDYVSSSEWKMKQIENVLTALVNNKFVSLNRQKSHSIVSSIYSSHHEKSKRRSRHKHCHNIKHHHHNHHHGNHNHHNHHHHHRDPSQDNQLTEQQDLCLSLDEDPQTMEEMARVQQWSSESDPQLYREGVRDGKVRRKRKRKRRRKRLRNNGRNGVVMIDPNDLPKRAKWTIIITAGLLLLTCMLLVGITLRMAPIIDQMVRNQNEELLNSLNRQELNESMYLMMGR
uniref:Uncharacterized protein n=1 Tax=Cacopsylla melanoneura TaxID=428564 RepID=A0A8D8SQN4_9HEMI